MSQARKCVLIVENEVIIADDISRLVKELGHVPLSPAFSFNHAIDFFLMYLPDLVILDIRLNGHKSGIDFAHWVRSQFNTPIIFLTIFEDQAHRNLGQGVLPISYLSKPFDDEQLKNAIQLAI